MKSSRPHQWGSDGACAYYLGAIADDFAVCEWDWSVDQEVCVADTAKESDETNNALAGGTIVVSP